MARPSTLPEPYAALASTLERQWLKDHPGERSPGGVTLASAELHCSPETLRRWAHGNQEPDPRAKAWITEVFRRRYMIGPFDKGF